MGTILHLTCSPRGPLAYSRMISGEVVERLLAADPAARIFRAKSRRDASGFRGRGLHRRHPRHPPDFDAPSLAVSETLISELEASDAVVIGKPMNNYTVPATLKAWIDQIVRIHRTFRSTPQGKVGSLATDPSMSSSLRGAISAARRRKARRHSPIF